VSAPKYLKCACRHCQGTIEFPAHGLGRAIPCPHCGQKTSLLGQVSASASADAVWPAPQNGLAPAPANLPTAESPEADANIEPPDEPIRPARTALRVGLFLLVLCVAGGALGFRLWQSTRHNPPGGANSDSILRRQHAATAAKPIRANPSTAPPAASVPEPTPAPKALSDLKAGAVKLEKTSGSSLVYAVGTLRNASAHQRYGVRIELALSTQDGRSAGTAKDYRAVLEPNQEWHFRALVLDSRADTARVASISEDE